MIRLAFYLSPNHCQTSMTSSESRQQQPRSNDQSPDIKQMIKDAVEEALEQQRRMILNESVSIKSVVNIDEADDDKNDSVVSASKYTNTPTTMLNSIQKLTITSKTNKYINIRAINHQLQQIGLLTMIIGQRVKPVPTRDNLYGYVKKMYAPLIVSNADDDDYCSLLSTKSYHFVSKTTSGVLLEADDIGRWDHDYIRLILIVDSRRS